MTTKPFFTPAELILIAAGERLNAKLGIVPPAPKTAIQIDTSARPHSGARGGQRQAWRKMPAMKNEPSRMDKDIARHEANVARDWVLQARAESIDACRPDERPQWIKDLEWVEAKMKRAADAGEPVTVHTLSKGNLTVDFIPFHGSYTFGYTVSIIVTDATKTEKDVKTMYLVEARAEYARLLDAGFAG